MSTAATTGRAEDACPDCEAKVDPMTETKEVMVLEEHAAMRNFLHGCVHASGYDALVADSAHDAVKRYRNSRPQAVILSLGASRSTRTLRTISVLYAIDPTVPIIVISGHARASLIAQAMTLGAADFVTAPFDESDIAAALTRAVHDAQRQVLRQRDHGRDATRPRLIGSSPAMTAVRQAIERAAATDLTVLIRGESGTGKTLVGREIVAASLRWDQPFVKVNCSSDDDLLNLEVRPQAQGLFGGLPDLAAKFACATNGTLFLDEIDEISTTMQSKLLKILQDRESAHLQGKQNPHTNVRVIVSSAGDLERAVAAGRVRQELFFRVNVLTIQLPPLRERREDIPELADYFLKHYSAQYQAPYDRVTEPTMRQLMEHDWPGNVRELDNVIRRIVLLGTDASVTSDLRSSPASSDQISSRSLKEHARRAAREAERVLILRTLEQTHWNRKEAASLLGISYNALLKKIKACDLQNT